MANMIFKFETINTGYEIALFTSLKMLFTNSNIIGCYYHFKAALVSKAREMDT